PNGTIYILTTSIHAPIVSPPSMNIPTPTAIAATTATALALEKLNLDCNASIGVSNKFTSDVIPAKNTATKKIIANSDPPGICLNISGIVININGGPAPGSIPNANTAGNITKEAIIAAIVSNTAIYFAEF